MKKMDSELSILGYLKSTLSEHNGKLLAAITGGGSGGAVFFRKDIASETGNISTALLLENLDKALTVNLFLSIAAVSMVIVSLLLPSLINSSNEISNLIRRNDSPGDERLVEFNRFVRAQKRLIACFLFCLIGVANSFTFDGVLEYTPESFSEASTKAHIAKAVGPEWADLAEGTTSTGILVIAITFLGLGGKRF